MMTSMPPNETPSSAASAAPSDRGSRPARPASPASPGRPGRPEKSRDESDVGWGERPEPDDDERFNRDRPPHWDSE
jgi:hypothetical protein